MKIPWVYSRLCQHTSQSTSQTSRDRVTSASFHFSLSRPRLKEPVHDAAAGRHEDAEPPPLVGAHVALGALEQDFVGQQVALDFAGGGRLGDEGVERRRGQHLWGREGHVEGHEWGAVGLVQVKALDLVVAVDGDEVLL
jgi:hypothetical protein